MESANSYHPVEDHVQVLDVHPYYGSQNPYYYSDYYTDNITTTGLADLYSVDISAKVILSISYTLMILICGTGNLLLCCVIYRFKRMRTVTNLLIGNLALSDFVVAAVVAPFNFYYYLHQTWPFGQVMCVIVGYLKVVSLYVSVNSLLTIAIDRYRTIMNPLRPRMTHSTTMIILVFIWLVSAGVVIPTAVYSKTFPLTLPGGPMTQCGEFGWSARALKINTLFLVIGEFMFPLFLMCIIYFLIARRLWFRQVPCDHLTEQQEATAEASKKRTIRMLIIVVGLFAFCWTPYNGFSVARVFFLVTQQDQIEQYKAINTAFYMVEALAMSNSMFNTLIYIFFNANFRKAVFQMFTPAHRTCSSGYQSTVRVRYSRPTHASKSPSNNHYDACNNRPEVSQETARTSFYQNQNTNCM